MSTDLLWPQYDTPDDLAAVESVPLVERGLPETTYALLVRAAELWPEKTAVSVLTEAAGWETPSTSTFATLLAEVHRYGNALHSSGVGRHDAVALLSPNCEQLIAATLAAELAGIAAPINPGLSTAHIRELLRRTGARVLIAASAEVDATVFATAHELVSDGTVDALFLLSPTGGTALATGADPRISYLSQAAESQDSAGFAGVPPKASDIASLFHTGGTTGTPKSAGHTHANEVADAWMIAANTLLGEDSTIFAALPLFHVNALVVTLLAPLFKGQHVLWAGPLGYRDFNLYGLFWKIVEYYGVSAMSAVPTVYSVLATCPVDADISSLKFAMVGASALPQAVRDGFAAHTGIELLEGYGLTEATCASVRSFPGHHRAGSVGQRLPYQGVKTVAIDEAGQWRELPVGEVGVLAISGPTVFPGYVFGRDDNRLQFDAMGKLRDGWLDTGDLARVDADGFVYLTGRAKDLIIRGGHNIDPQVIEDALLAHPDVTGAQAVGRPDRHSGEVPVAYVTVVAGCAITPDALREWTRSQITEQAALPREITVLDALPVTDVGKPYKLALRARATEDAVAEELADVPGAVGVTAVVEDGSTVAIVSLATEEAREAVSARLDQYALAWRIEVDHG